jgi:hypothetical protein
MSSKRPGCRRLSRSQRKTQTTTISSSPIGRAGLCVEKSAPAIVSSKQTGSSAARRRIHAQNDSGNFAPAVS